MPQKKLRLPEKYPTTSSECDLLRDDEEMFDDLTTRATTVLATEEEIQTHLREKTTNTLEYRTAVFKKYSDLEGTQGMLGVLQAGQARQASCHTKTRRFA